MQRQYQLLRAENPNALLFFRLGDFYELFYEDAQVASRLLGIQLTARHKGTENEMPMCGFPHHASEEYLLQLIEAGYSVAIAEQVDAPDGTITREIVRVVTPSTMLEGGYQKPFSQYLLCLHRSSSEPYLYAIAYSDPTTGEFRTAQLSDPHALQREVYTLRPKEILMTSPLYDEATMQGFCPEGTMLTPVEPLPSHKAQEILRTHFGFDGIEAFGLRDIALSIEASALILRYLQRTQRAPLSHIRRIERYQIEQTLILDQQTLRHLEIFEPLQHREVADATLWGVLEPCATAMGQRMLREWMRKPLTSIPAIEARYDAIEPLTQHPHSTDALHRTLQRIPDLERAMGRIASNRATARELLYVRDGLSAIASLAELPTRYPGLPPLPGLESAPESLLQELTVALRDEVPKTITEGGIFRSEYHAPLAELRQLSAESQQWMERYVAQLQEQTGITSLRMKYSSSFGHMLEVPNAHKAKVPETWQRRQTLVNAERYTTPELEQYASRSLSAGADAAALEYQLFQQLSETVVNHMAAVQSLAHTVALVDSYSTLARTAVQYRWCRPELTEDTTLQITAGRHPVVERFSTQQFITNNTHLTPNSRLHLLTGPNMGGKSTYLRQCALIVLLAHMGSFIPAASALIGITDRICTRVGASDSVATGKSTFYTEMTETAAILYSATEKSLVILDEIGRGTSTYDGLSLAWALTEHFAEHIQCRTLFATHYHELVGLVQSLPTGNNYHMAVLQTAQGLQFLWQVREGGMQESFGIEVARQAGIPQSITRRAEQILQKLEEDDMPVSQPGLFTVVETPSTPSTPSNPPDPRLALLSATNIDDLTPRQALALLYELQKKPSA